jgi:hypothetical protein
VNTFEGTKHCNDPMAGRTIPHRTWVHEEGTDVDAHTPRRRLGSPLARLAALALLVTTGSALAWMATGRHVFTKYEAIEERAHPPAADDPFAAAGFYDGNTAPQVVHVDAFHFGLLPSAGSVLDKHVLSLSTVAAPLWAVTLAFAWRRRSRRRRLDVSTHPPRRFTCHHC